MDQVILPIRAKPRVGTLIISLDFEIYWGIRHLPSADKYRRQLVGARSAVPELLKLFTEYGIHATWACVGFLFFDSTERLLRFAPKVIPRYKSIHLSPYRDLPPDDASETSDSVFFAPSLIRLIAQTPNQEIGSHTFSHYYCLEEGQNLKTFREDLLAAQGTAQSFGLKMRSLAFPQNQVQERFLAVCREIGIVAYRGNQDSRIYRASSEHDENTSTDLPGLLTHTYHSSRPPIRSRDRPQICRSICRLAAFYDLTVGPHCLLNANACDASFVS